MEPLIRYFSGRSSFDMVSQCRLKIIMKFKGTILSDKNQSQFIFEIQFQYQFFHNLKLIASFTSTSISPANQITQKPLIWNRTFYQKKNCLETKNRYLTTVILKSECSLRNYVRNIVRPKSLLAILISFSNAVTLNKGLVISRLGMCSFCINDLDFVTELAACAN